MKSIPSVRYWGLAALVALAVLPCRGQIVVLSQVPTADPLVHAERWREAGGHVGEESELERSLLEIGPAHDRAGSVFLLARNAFESGRHEESFQWSGTFLSEFPNDPRADDALEMRAVSAFQTDRVDIACAILDSAATSGSADGSIRYWMAMCKLERDDWDGAGRDFQAAYLDSNGRHRDDALLGWSIALERRGSIDSAADLVRSMLTEFPGSRFVTDARIRLASLSLRQGNADRTLELLSRVEHSLTRQNEEDQLLTAEAQLQKGQFQDAFEGFQHFLTQFDDSPFTRRAQYGLAWSLLKKGEIPKARDEFDSLAMKNDSLGNGALYQSAVLSLIEGNLPEASAKFTLLTDRSPYGPHVDKAYFQLGMLQYRNGKYREARRSFQILTRLFSESELALHGLRMLGESNMAVADFSNAQHAFARVRKMSAPDELLAPSMMQEGIALYHLGRFKSSAERLSDFISRYRDHPSLDQAVIWRGEAMYQDGRYEEAERDFSDAIKRFPTSPIRSKAAYGYAWALFEQKKFSNAAAAFEKFTREFPDDEKVVDARLRQADSYFFLRQYERASAMYSSLSNVKSNPRYAEYAAFQLAMSYIQRGETHRGIEELRDFLVSFPSSIYNEVVQFNIAWTYFSLEQYRDAIEEFRMFRHKYAESQLMPRALFSMGDVYYNLRQYDSARVHYQHVIERYPESPLVKEAMNGLQFAYEAEGNPQEALRSIEEMLRSQPKDSVDEELLLKKGDILFGQGDYAGALMEYQHVLELGPGKATNASALWQIGRIYELESNLPLAISYYEQIVNEFSDLDIAAPVTLGLGVAYMKGREFRKATDVLQDFATRFPESPLVTEASYQRGVALLNLKLDKEAHRQFRLIIEERPSDVFAERSRLQIARLHQDKREFQAALDTLDSIIARRGDDVAAEALLLVGETYLMMKRPREALQAYKDVAEQFTDFPALTERARLGIGDSYERLNERTLAREEYTDLSKNAVDPAVRKEAQERLRRLR